MDSLYFIQHGYNVTAFDASEEMVKYASKLTGLIVKQLKFEDVNYIEEFDGIWACASLLHLPNNFTDLVMDALIRALKPQGVMDISLKYGDGNKIRNGRIFNYNEEKIYHLFRNHPSVELLSNWVTNDIRWGMENDKWLNVLVKKY